MSFEEEKAKDSLAFDPLPTAVWLSKDDKSIIVSVRYGERLSALLKSIRGAQWNPATRQWRFPFSSAELIRGLYSEIDCLAQQAKDVAEMENEVRSKARIAAKQAKDQKVLADRRLKSQQPVAMQTDFLHPKKAPYYILKLEAIGAHPPKHLAAYYKPPNREWVAQIMGVDGRGKFVRAFLDGDRDYSGANSVGSRGVDTFFKLETGPIYEVAAPQSWRSTNRYFCRIECGLLYKMTEQEVISCLGK